MFYSEEKLIHRIQAQAWAIGIAMFKVACLVLVLGLIFFLLTAPDTLQEIARQVPIRVVDAFGGAAESYAGKAHDTAATALKEAAPKKKRAEAAGGQAGGRDASTTSRSSYFTVGSSKEDVLAIQGRPARVDGNVWYYGQSEVTFLADRVAGWRSQDVALRAAIIPGR